MITLEFELPPGLNKIINSNRANVYAGASQKKTWTNKAVKACKAQSLGLSCPIVPVYLAVHYRITTRANDIDNIQSTKKFILDGMVKAGVIKDDNFTHIQPMIFETFEFVGRKGVTGVTLNLFTEKLEFTHYIEENCVMRNSQEHL
jgi:Holliday junction resolvase RusA-like endonuclease